MAADPPLQVKKSRSQAEAVIDRHLEEGRKLLDLASGVGAESNYNDWNKTRRRWINLTSEGLKSIYTNGEPSEEFERATNTPIILGGAGIAQEFEWQREAADAHGAIVTSPGR